MTTRKQIEPPTDADYALAVQVAEWLTGLSETEQSNDYMHNLSVYGRIGVLNERGSGIVASAISSFNKELAKRQTQRDLSGSIHFGTVKERVDLSVEILSVYEGSGDFGPSFSYKMLTPEGNVVQAWTTKHLYHFCTVSGSCDECQKPLQPGAKLWIRGTIKAHKEYKGVKETQLNRVEVVADPETAKAMKAAAKTKEVAAGTYEFDGVEYPVFDIVRADGKTTSFVIRAPAQGKKKGEQIYKSSVDGASFSDMKNGGEQWTLNVREQVKRSLTDAARKAFGEHKTLVRYICTSEYARYGDDEQIDQISQKEFQLLSVSTQYERGQRTYWTPIFPTLEEACAEAEKRHAQQASRTYRKEVL